MHRSHSAFSFLLTDCKSTAAAAFDLIRICRVFVVFRLFSSRSVTRWLCSKCLRFTPRLPMNRPIVPGTVWKDRLIVIVSEVGGRFLFGFLAMTKLEGEICSVCLLDVCRMRICSSSAFKLVNAFSRGHPSKLHFTTRCLTLIASNAPTPSSSLVCRILTSK